MIAAYRTKMQLNWMCDDDRYDYKALVVSATISDLLQKISIHKI